MTDSQPLDERELCRHLRECGIDVLAVTDHIHPRQLLVFLHGNAGRINQEDAVRVLTSVPGVMRVVESVQTWTILTVHLTDQPTDPSEG